MSQVFRKGLVIDVLCNLIDVDRNEEIAEYQKLITSKYLKSFPRNTAIVKDLTRGSSKRDDKKLVCLPFLSSHLAMPLKPGEVVWFIYEDPDDPGEIAYWISRLSAPAHIEDVNFAFYSRAFKQNPNESQPTSSETFDGAAVDEGETQTFSYVSPTGNPGEMVELINLSKRVHRFEPVPRYSKRPGDLVLQGSNNTLIMLGEERGQTAESSDDIKFTSNVAGIPVESGAIDIVVGRGKVSATAGETIVNELGITEINKRKNIETEGDAHFFSDAARVYLTSNSSDDAAAYHPDEMLNIALPSSNGFSNLSYGSGSFAIVKADNLRIVGRDSGTIRIVKEPTGSTTNGSAIVMHNDGNLQLAAKKVSLSSYRAGRGTQPYVRYNELTSLLNSILTDITTFCATLATHVTPGFGAPSPQITAAAIALQTSITSKSVLLQSGLVQVDGTPQNLGSVIIYGE